MIKAILVFNNHGKPRLSKFYQYFVSKTFFSLLLIYYMYLRACNIVLFAYMYRSFVRIIIQKMINGKMSVVVPLVFVLLQIVYVLERIFYDYAQWKGQRTTLCIYFLNCSTGNYIFSIFFNYWILAFRFPYWFNTMVFNISLKLFGY